MKSVPGRKRGGHKTVDSHSSSRYEHYITLLALLLFSRYNINAYRLNSAQIFIDIYTIEREYEKERPEQSIRAALVAVLRPLLDKTIFKTG